MKYIVINTIFHMEDRETNIYNIGMVEDPNEATKLMLEDYKTTLESLNYNEKEIASKIITEKEVGNISNTEAELEYNSEEYYKWQILTINNEPVKLLHYLNGCDDQIEYKNIMDTYVFKAQANLEEIQLKVCEIWEAEEGERSYSDIITEFFGDLLIEVIETDEIIW